MTLGRSRTLSKGTAVQRGSGWNPSTLQKQMIALAALLIGKGMTAKSFEQLARCAFVQAATKGSTFRNGRVNYSRVAARTGLTRAEVRRVLSAGSDFWPQARSGPLERVVLGWRTDRHFIDQYRRPRRLTVTGDRHSFANLAKQYAKDVPHKALLEELLRIGAVVVSGTNVKLSARLPISSPPMRKMRAPGLE